MYWIYHWVIGSTLSSKALRALLADEILYGSRDFGQFDYGPYLFDESLYLSVLPLAKMTRATFLHPLAVQLNTAGIEFAIAGLSKDGSNFRLWRPAGLYDDAQDEDGRKLPIIEIKNPLGE